MAYSQKTIDAVKADYLENKISLDLIAEKNGVSYNTVDRWRMRFNWPMRIPNNSRKPNQKTEPHS